MTTERGKEGQPDRNSPEFIKQVKDRAFYRSQRKTADVGIPRDADYVQAEEEQLLKAEIVGEVGAQVDQGIADARTAAADSRGSADLAETFKNSASSSKIEAIDASIRSEAGADRSEDVERKVEKAKAVTRRLVSKANSFMDRSGNNARSAGKSAEAAQAAREGSETAAGEAKTHNEGSATNAARSIAGANRSEDAVIRAETARTGAEDAKDATVKIAGEVDEKLKKLGDDITRAKTALVEEVTIVITEKTAHSIAEINKTAGQVEQNAATAKGHADRAATAQEGAEKAQGFAETHATDADDAARRTALDKEATGRDRADVDGLARQASAEITAGIRNATAQAHRAELARDAAEIFNTQTANNASRADRAVGGAEAHAAHARQDREVVNNLLTQAEQAAGRATASETNAAGSASAAATSERNSTTALADTLRANREQERRNQEQEIRNQEQQARNRSRMKFIIGAYVLGGVALAIAAIMALNSGHETNVVIDRSQISGQTNESKTITIDGTPITP